MPNEISTKRKVIGGAAIALGVAETTVGVALTAAGSAPVPNPLLVPGLVLIGKGCTTTSAGIGTITNFKNEESRISKFLRSNPVIPTVRVSRAKVATSNIKESRFDEFLRLSGFVSTRRVSKANEVPDYIRASNDLANSSTEPVMTTKNLIVTAV